MPNFFRYSYILGSAGYLEGDKVRLTVHGYVFTFSVDEERGQLVKDRVTDLFSSLTGISLDEVFIQSEEPEDSDGSEKNNYKDLPGNLQVWEGEEYFEPVDSEEVRGTGFYYPVIEVNDSRHEKADIRHGLWGAIRSFIKRLGGNTD